MSLCRQTSFKCIIGSLESVDKDGRSHAALKIQTTPSSVPLPMPKILGLSHRRAVPLTIPGFLLVRTRVLFQHPLQPDPIATMYTALGQMRLVGSRTVRGHQKWERHQEAEKTGMPAMNSCSVHGTFHQFGMPLFGSDAPNWGTTKTAQTEPWKMVIETGARDWRL